VDLISAVSGAERVGEKNMREGEGNEVNYWSLFPAFHCRTVAAIVCSLHGAVISPAVGGDDADTSMQGTRGVGVNRTFLDDWPLLLIGVENF
jgi:hypothetical protein